MQKNEIELASIVYLGRFHTSFNDYNCKKMNFFLL